MVTELGCLEELRRLADRRKSAAVGKGRRLAANQDIRMRLIYGCGSISMPELQGVSGGGQRGEKEMDGERAGEKSVGKRDE